MNIDPTLVDALIKGDETMIIPVIEHFRYMVDKVVNKYCFSGKNRSDLVHVAECSLVELINTCCGKGDFINTNFDGYVMVTLKTKLLTFVQSDFTVRLPHWTKAVLTDADHNTDSLERAWSAPLANYRPLIVPIENIGGLIRSRDNGAVYDESDILDSLGLSPLDRVIVLGRLEDQTLKEIGEKLDLSYVTIHNRIEAIKEKLISVGICPPKEKEVVGEKVCSKCKVTKPLSCFYLKQRHPPVYKTACKDCYISNVQLRKVS